MAYYHSNAEKKIVCNKICEPQGKPMISDIYPLINGPTKHPRAEDDI